MDRLHSYWRMPYIEAPKPSQKINPFRDLFTCADDRQAYIVYRGKTGLIILNAFPYNAGHLLVLPYREVAELSGLTPEERAELMDLIVLSQDILQKALNPDGFNIGFNFGKAAGAGIPHHLHCHVVPRWEGDTNFMPVVGNTRVLPQALDAMWERLTSVADTFRTSE